MSKSDTPLDQIDVSSAKRKLSNTRVDDFRVAGWDTETNDGHVFALSATTSEGTDTLHNAGDNIDPNELLQFLTKRKYSETKNMWFNISFDAEAILSDVLDTEQLEKMKLENEVVYASGTNAYLIKYIRGKLMKITTVRLSEDGEIERKFHTYEHYDISNITMSGSLEATANEWLGESKADDDLDVDRFSEETYRKNNLPKIIKYVRQDSKITYDLSRKVVDVYTDISIPMHKPISTGYVASEYVRNLWDKKPGFGPRKLQSLSWDAFHGGRFEVLEKGFVGEVTIPDINSAYPDKMRKLPDLGTCNIGYTPSLNKIRDADWSVLRVRVTTKPDKRIQPFAYKTDKVRFPVLEDVEITTIKQVFLFALENDYIEDYEILEAVNVYETSETEYPFSFMESLYDQRKTWENEEQQYKRANGLKIVLNSMYGKTAQTTIKQRIVDPGVDVSNIDLKDSESVKSRFGRMIIEEQTSGRLFNPFYAAHITGLTRVQLHETVEDLDLVDDVIMLATDSIMVRRDAFENSDFDEYMQNEEDSYAERLGKWDFDAERGIGYVIGSGVYEVLDDAGDVVKRGTRGFKELQKSVGTSTLVEAMRQYEQEIPLESYRPTTIGEAIAMGQIDLSIEDVAKFRTTSRKLTPDFDDKRVWEHDEGTPHEFELHRMVYARQLREDLVDKYGERVLDASDHRGRTVVRLIPDAPRDALDDAGLSSLTAEKEVNDGTGVGHLTDAEKRNIDFSERGYMHAAKAKAAILDAGVKDWMTVYTTKETVDELRALALEGKQAGDYRSRLDEDDGEVTSSQLSQLERARDHYENDEYETAGLTMHDLLDRSYTSEPMTVVGQ